MSAESRKRDSSLTLNAWGYLIEWDFSDELRMLAKELVDHLHTLFRCYAPDEADAYRVIHVE